MNERDIDVFAGIETDAQEPIGVKSILNRRLSRISLRAAVCAWSTVFSMTDKAGANASMLGAIRSDAAAASRRTV